MKRPAVPAARTHWRSAGIPAFVIGEVMEAHPAANRMRVRLSGFSGRVIKNVVLTEGANYHSGDRVLLAHMDDHPYWIAVTRVLDSHEYGQYAGQKSGSLELHPPDNFVLEGEIGALIARWNCWAGNTVCWDVQFNSAGPVEETASTFYTRGGHFVLPVEASTAIYARVRSLRYDADNYTTYYSNWSSWLSASPQAYVEAEAAELIRYDTGRTRWLGELQTIDTGYDGSVSGYLTANSVTMSAGRGVLIPNDTTIIGLSWAIDSGVSGNFEVRRSGDTISTVAIGGSATGSDMSLSDDFGANGILSVWSSVSVANPSVRVYFRRRPP